MLISVLRWRGGSFQGWFFCHWLVVIAVKQLYMFSCWLTINLSLGRCRRSTILSILSGRSHTWFQPVEVNNLNFLSTLKAFDFVIAFPRRSTTFSGPFQGWTPSKVTWIQWLLWSEKVSRHCMKSLRTIRSSNRASVLQIVLYYSPVKCHHVSLMTRGVLHGKSKEHLVCNLLWCMAWQAVNSTCLFNSSVVHYSSPPDWAIWSWTNSR